MGYNHNTSNKDIEPWIVTALVEMLNEINGLGKVLCIGRDHF